MLTNLLVIFLGLAGGLAVGSGFVAFLSVLGIIPRLMQLTKTGHRMHQYEWAIVSGALCSTWIGLRSIPLYMGIWVTIPVGLFCGMFIGMLAAALTEVLNVFPILAKRIGIEAQMIGLLMAIVFGKVLGSLFHWIIFVK
ncbi:stage V sporulation protein AB [Aureibacillus halotolerans]|uniref:Stage V sporulation protein AB n=1 Tax=Aureibacillus halotolerans TaxID=1508390 RepID=A0A4R6U752_9BACI|nr:stage V sporulation protein AB [Aureibacillus halotolerans]TDQ41596.1 stage V sporulation protein AB [Aureibacillus halotolerans]